MKFHHPNTTIVALAILMLLPFRAIAWNIPGHMITGALAYRILHAERPKVIGGVETILQKHPWYIDRWRPDLEALPDGDRGEMLFMLGARWADDIRIKDRSQHRGSWHYINFPFKPTGEPATLGVRPPEPVNILTAIDENKRLVREAIEPETQAVAVSWLFHLVGDIHQPLHTVSLFTQKYPTGDRGGNENCLRVSSDRASLNLHRLWDGLITSTNNPRRLGEIATDLYHRFPKTELIELANNNSAAWADESLEIATKITYQNGRWAGTPKGERKDCREVKDAALAPRGYALIAKKIAERRLVLSAYRLADLLHGIVSR